MALDWGRSPSALTLEVTGKQPLLTTDDQKKPRLPAAAWACALLLASCAQSGEGLPPPGFGGTPDRLFFPTGLALSDDGASLYIANSDFDRAYSNGSVVQLDLAAFDAPSPVTDISPFVLTRGLTDRYGAMLAKSPSGRALFLPTADPDALTRIPLATGGGIACENLNCSQDRVDLGAAGLSDPSSVAIGEVLLPGAEVPEPVIFVLPLTQPSTNEDEEGLSARVAVIPERLASGAAAPFENGAFTVDIGAGGAGVVYDAAGGQAYIAGCFERFKGGDTIECSINEQSDFFGLNPLRSFLPQLGASAPVETTVLGSVTGGASATALATSSDGETFFVLTTSPDALLAVERPTSGNKAGRVKTIVPLPAVPRGLVVLPRPGGDWLAITSLESNALLIVDSVSGLVLHQLRPLGLSPYALVAQTLADKWRVYVTLFAGCGVAAVDVPMNDPSATTLVTTVGACP